MVTFHRVQDAALACDDCGCVVDAGERGRAAHQRWHDRQQVVDLRMEELAHA